MVRDIRIPVKKKVLAPISYVEDCPENLYLPKAEFVKRRKAMREARHKAEEAYKKEMASQLSEENIELRDADADVRKKRQLVATLTGKVNEIEAELKDASEGEVRAIKMQLTKAKNKLEDAELKLKESEEAYEIIKSQA